MHLLPNGFIDKCDMLATHIHGNTTGGGNFRKWSVFFQGCKHYLFLFWFAYHCVSFENPLPMQCECCCYGNHTYHWLPHTEARLHNWSERVFNVCMWLQLHKVSSSTDSIITIKNFVRLYFIYHTYVKLLHSSQRMQGSRYDIDLVVTLCAHAQQNLCIHGVCICQPKMSKNVSSRLTKAFTDFTSIHCAVSEHLSLTNSTRIKYSMNTL